MQIRRMISLLERPHLIVWRSKGTPNWNGYGGYNPAVTEQVLHIFRTYYNYCKPGQDGQTPAMRIGLAQRCLTPGEILGVTAGPELDAGQQAPEPAPPEPEPELEEEELCP